MSKNIAGLLAFFAAGSTAQYGQFQQYSGSISNYFPGGEYGRNCRKGVVSEDLPGGFQSCFCDKNHRDEDPCDGVTDPGGPGRRLLGSALTTPAECRRFFDYYKDNIFDEDCVQQYPAQQQQSMVRRCPSKTKSKDLAGPAACWCDANHVQDWDNDENCFFDERRRNLLAPTWTPLIFEGELDEEWAVALHYEDDTGKQINQKYIDDDGYDAGNDCDDVASFEDEWEAYDPNCVERFGGYGGWGGFRFPQFQQQPQFLQQQSQFFQQQPQFLQQQPQFLQQQPQFLQQQPQYPVLGGR